MTDFEIKLLTDAEFTALLDSKPKSMEFALTAQMYSVPVEEVTHNMRDHAMRLKLNRIHERQNNE